MLFTSIVGRSVVYKFLADTIGRLASFLVLITIAQKMGAASMGIYAFANGVAAYVAVASDLGMHLFLTREIAAGQRDVKSLIGSLFVLKLLVNTSLALIMTVLIFGSSGWNEESRVLLIILWATVCYSFTEFFTAILRGYNAIVAESNIALLFRVARTAAGIAVLWLFASLTGLAVVIAALSLITSLCAGVYVFRRWVRPELSLSWTKVKAAALQYLPIGLGLFVTLLYTRSDILIIRVLLTPVHVGLYDAAYRIFDAVQIFPAILLAVLYPRFSAIGGIHYFWRALALLELLALSLTVFVLVFGTPLVSLAFGKNFGPSSTVLKLLFLALPIMFANAALINYLIATRRQWAYIVAAVFAFFFKTGANLVAIPRFGLHGAAVTAVLTECVILATCLAFALRTGTKVS